MAVNFMKEKKKMMDLEKKIGFYNRASSLKDRVRRLNNNMLTLTVHNDMHTHT